ncbi:MAG TPA: aminopeptidase P N-terminal domain-containing protein, partial [Edaphobacter sp.]|nr:aminopeptidase P N-terminal domain-containing protein [Edaphobacter sp.]
MKKIFGLVIALVCSAAACHAFESVPKPEYHERRVALAARMKTGVAILFANEEPSLEYQEFRQDEDFYYLTGWNEPGAAIIIIPPADAEPETPGTGLGGRAAQAYREILFLPSRIPRMEKYTGAKMDAATPNVTTVTGFDEVMPMTELPSVLNKLALSDRMRMQNVWAEKNSTATNALLGFVAATLRMPAIDIAQDVSEPLMELRAIKSPAEVELIRK